MEKCFVLYDLPVNERVREWVQASVHSLNGVKFDDYMQKLASQEYVSHLAVVRQTLT